MRNWMEVYAETRTAMNVSGIVASCRGGELCKAVRASAKDRLSAGLGACRRRHRRRLDSSPLKTWQVRSFHYLFVTHPGTKHDLIYDAQILYIPAS